MSSSLAPIGESGTAKVDEDNAITYFEREGSTKPPTASGEGGGGSPRSCKITSDQHVLTNNFTITETKL